MAAGGGKLDVEELVNVSCLFGLRFIPLVDPSRQPLIGASSLVQWWQLAGVRELSVHEIVVFVSILRDQGFLQLLVDGSWFRSKTRPSPQDVLRVANLHHVDGSICKFMKSLSSFLFSGIRGFLSCW